MIFPLLATPKYNVPSRCLFRMDTIEIIPYLISAELFLNSVVSFSRPRFTVNSSFITYGDIYRDIAQGSIKHSFFVPFVFSVQFVLLFRFFALLLVFF